MDVEHQKHTHGKKKNLGYGQKTSQKKGSRNKCGFHGLLRRMRKDMKIHSDFRLPTLSSSFGRNPVRRIRWDWTIGGQHPNHHLHGNRHKNTSLIHKRTSRWKGCVRLMLFVGFFWWDFFWGEEKLETQGICLKIFWGCYQLPKINPSMKGCPFGFHLLPYQKKQNLWLVRQNKSYLPFFFCCPWSFLQGSSRDFFRFWLLVQIFEDRLLRPPMVGSRAW